MNAPSENTTLGYETFRVLQLFTQSHFCARNWHQQLALYVSDVHYKFWPVLNMLQFVYFCCLLFTLIRLGFNIFCLLTIANLYDLCWSIMDIKCFALSNITVDVDPSWIKKCLLCFWQYIYCPFIHHGHKMCYCCWSLMDIEYL